MYAAGGPEFFNKATHYEEGIWDTPEDVYKRQGVHVPEMQKVPYPAP